MRPIYQALLLVALPVLGGCNRAPPSTDEGGYGEPIRVQMEASAGLPAFEMAVAVSEGVVVEPLVPPLAGALHAAIKGCSAFVAASVPGEVTQLAFTVEQGKAAAVRVTGEHPDPCLVSGMDGRAIALPDAQRPVRVLAQIRFTVPAPGEGQGP